MTSHKEFNLQEYLDSLDVEYLKTLSDTEEKELFLIAMSYMRAEQMLALEMLFKKNKLAYVAERKRLEENLEEYRKYIVLETPQFISIMEFFEDLIQAFLKTHNYIWN